MDCKYQGLTWWKGRGFQPEHVKWQQLRNALTVIRDYADRINLVVMVPQAASAESPSSTRYCLYNNGTEYLVYQRAHQTAFTVELPSGSYRYEWINPVARGTLLDDLITQRAHRAADDGVIASRHARCCTCKLRNG